MYDDLPRDLQGVAQELDRFSLAGFAPVVSESNRFIRWMAQLGPATCPLCRERNEKIYEKDNPPEPVPPVHGYCRCSLNAMSAILAGTASIDDRDGADYTVKHYGRLPDGYVTKQYAEDKGWKPYLGNLRTVLPDATIGGVVFYNDLKVLPEKIGRRWYEADLNYTGGYRNKHRLLYSNDGLMFVTYDHYRTFYEVI